MLSKKISLVACFMLLISSALPSIAHAIDAPADPRGIEVGQSTVKWEWSRVSGAVHYAVYVDGNFADITRDPQYFSRNLWAGDHSLTVRSVDGSGVYSSSTPTVKIRVNQNYNAGSPARGTVVGGSRTTAVTSAAAPQTQRASSGFGTPQNPRGTELAGRNVKWEWNAVSNASQYEVTVDGAFAGTTGGLEFTSNNLWVGEHSMTVKAVDSNGRKSEQSNTVKINVNGQSGGAVASTASAPPPPQRQSDPNAASVQSLIDPASYNYPEVNQKQGYELVFSDEFNGNALNPYRWHTQLRWDGEFNGERFEYRVINGEDQFYVNPFSKDQAHKDQIVPRYNPFQFNGSRMAIRAKRNPLKTNNNKRTFGSLSEISQQQTFLSGAISTHEKFSQKYGYFEARIKIPSHVGTFPAFWLFHEKRAWEGTQRTEIDIMENLGHAPWYVYNSFHYFKNVSVYYGGDASFVKPQPSGQIYNGTDFSNDFHVYAVDWQPGKVTWYIDGQQVSVLENNEVNYEELYLMINLAMGGNWTNFPANAGGLGRPGNERYPTQNDLNNFNDPALEIDYVRVYRRR